MTNLDATYLILILISLQAPFTFSYCKKTLFYFFLGFAKFLVQILDSCGIFIMSKGGDLDVKRNRNNI